MKRAQPSGKGPMKGHHQVLVIMFGRAKPERKGPVKAKPKAKGAK